MAEPAASQSTTTFHAASRKGQCVRYRLTGVAASAGTVEGPCTVIRNLHDHLPISEGAILVCESASRELACYVQSLRGLVTRRGGLLSIGSVYAREYGIPAVVGVRGITEIIRSGDVIRVDGSAGTVEIVGKSISCP